MWSQVRKLLRKLIANPFLPLLFWSELIKIFALQGNVHPGMLSLSIVSTVIWVWLSDEIYEKAEDAVDNAEETVDEVTDE